MIFKELVRIIKSDAIVNWSYFDCIHLRQRDNDIAKWRCNVAVWLFVYGRSEPVDYLSDFVNVFQHE